MACSSAKIVLGIGGTLGVCVDSSLNAYFVGTVSAGAPGGGLQFFPTVYYGDRPLDVSGPYGGAALDLAATVGIHAAAYTNYKLASPTLSQSSFIVSAGIHVGQASGPMLELIRFHKLY